MYLPSNPAAIIYTDGSWHSQTLRGAWVAIIVAGKDKEVLSGLEENTSHHRMELTAVIKAIDFVRDRYGQMAEITVYTDSQYVTGLSARKHRLTDMNFISKKGKPLPNADLVKKLLALFELMPVETIKVKAHQKSSGLHKFNIEADFLARRMVRHSDES